MTLAIRMLWMSMARLEPPISSELSNLSAVLGYHNRKLLPYHHQSDSLKPTPPIKGVTSTQRGAASPLSTSRQTNGTP